MDVFFAPAMVAHPDSFSPSARKPAQVVASWADLPIRIVTPTPVTVDELARAHDRDWVCAVLEGRAPNGFGDRSPDVARSLPWTSGAMLSAARRALARRSITCAPCSGFHHAGWDAAEGFCTFNGLVVTACALLAEGARRIGILDCDMHYGDGTDAILDRLELRERVVHWTAGAEYGRREDVPAFFAALPRVLRTMGACDVVLFQAGADPHVDDPLGGWLTTAELAERDRLVFRGLRALGVPVAWNLAGGYQREADGSIPKVIAIHRNTAHAAIEVMGS
jgi:acetoin utilization deacetylase AcuC-like enzyme